LTGTELKKLRLALGITQLQLARDLEVSELTVWRWEGRKGKPVSKLVALAMEAYAAKKR
jgi:transcriptional regulator with XRE-family HTH domain